MPFAKCGARSGLPQILIYNHHLLQGPNFCRECKMHAESELYIFNSAETNSVLYHVGDIKCPHLVVTQEIILTWGSHAYTDNDLPPSICDCLAQQLAVTTALLVMWLKTSLEYWYRPAVIGLPSQRNFRSFATVSKSPTKYH